MEPFVTFLKDYQVLLGVLGAVATFSWPVFQFLLVRSRELEAKEFETYHRLIKELVQGDGDGVYIDRQCAIVFELCRLKRYWPVTCRILAGLDAGWSTSAAYHRRLRKEIEIALLRCQPWHIRAWKLTQPIRVYCRKYLP